MTRVRTGSLPLVLLVFLIGGLLGAQIQSSISSDDALEQFQKMKQAFVLISGKYVNQVDPADLASGGVNGMVDRLDPFSDYIPPRQARELQSEYEGSFGGVGLTFNILDDTARVIRPIAGGPSEDAGVMAGDRIVLIEDSTAVGTSERELKERLKGRIGTPVTFTVYRPLSDKRLTFTIERAEIPLYSIHSSYLIDAKTGYIRIDRFSESTHREFTNEVGKLKKNGMRRLILDLRQNHGGVMKAAIRIADELLDAGGEPIVQTKGRVASLNQTWRAQNGGVFTSQPIIVLVDENTASASEILAGALQDHDRALLVGRRTFGKALVQKPFHLKDGSLLNLAVGRYYTPVGRLIQTPYDRGDEGSYDERNVVTLREAVDDVDTYKSQIPDSLTYRTNHGRIVFGGGGILPDHVVQPDTTSLTGFLGGPSAHPLFTYVAYKWLSNHERAVRSAWQHRKSEFLSSYSVPETAVSEFWRYVQSDGILTLTSDPHRVDPRDHVYPHSQVDSTERIVRAHLKGQLANILYGTGAGAPSLNEVDPTVQKALSLWSSSQQLAEYHTPSEGPAGRDE